MHFDVPFRGVGGFVTVRDEGGGGGVKFSKIYRKNVTVKKNYVKMFSWSGFL